MVMRLTTRKKGQESSKMAAQTLQDLYKLEPTARAAIYKSAGYAVFNNMGTNLLLLNTARGAGIAVNAQTKQETFMKMISGAGLGIGVKDYRVLFVFENDKPLAQFLDSGWSGSRKRTPPPRQGRRAELIRERSNFYQIICFTGCLPMRCIGAHDSRAP
jgi:hypothetical protein